MHWRWCDTIRGGTTLPISRTGRGGWHCFLIVDKRSAVVLPVHQEEAGERTPQAREELQAMLDALTTAQEAAGRHLLEMTLIQGLSATSRPPSNGLRKLDPS